ncbi:MAG TPA: septum formation initiator family protein [Vicinamibacterales bacterium]|jgi:cell division protein FtsB|nr:septum formation initiator family protein [Vicinamibacterales bacterium]
MSETDLSPAPTSSSRARRRLTAQETRVRHRRVAMWTLSLMLGALLVNAVVGENGYLATVRAAREEAALRTTVAQLRLENQHLQAEGRRLQTDPTAVEEVARRELGMVRSGETMIVIRDATSAAPSVSK